MAGTHSYLLSVVLPGAGHIHEHRHALGWPLAILWTVCWHVILIGTWVIPRFFADWMVPAAIGTAALLWPAALVSLAVGRAAPAAAPPTPAPAPAPAPDSPQTAAGK